MNKLITIATLLLFCTFISITPNTPKLKKEPDNSFIIVMADQKKRKGKKHHG